MVAPLAVRGRYLVYFCMGLALFYMSSSNLLYLLGLWISDFHAAGYVRRIQDHWKPTVAIEVLVMAGGLALVAGAGTVATSTDRWFAKWTMYEGRFGYNRDLIWPQCVGVRPSSLTPQVHAREQLGADVRDSAVGGVLPRDAVVL